MTEVGKTYLCEVWAFPPEICNGPEIKKGVMRFLGRAQGNGRTRVLTCGDTRFELRSDCEQDIWEPAPGSGIYPGELYWKIIPIRPLEQDVEQEEAVPVMVIGRKM